MDGRWTTISGAARGQEEEGRRDKDLHSRDEQRRPHQHSLQGHHTIEIPSHQELALLRVPSRRPSRPFRKREKRSLDPESYHANPSGPLDLLRLASAGLGEEIAIAGRPSHVAIDRNVHQRQQEKRGTAVAGARASAAAPEEVALSISPASFSPTSHNQRRLPLFSPSFPPARSTTRVISSETYLRRLFVTASLAHVLSLDVCLPRSVPMRRRLPSRAAGRGEGWGEEEKEGAGCGAGQKTGSAGDICSVEGWGGHHIAGGRNNGGTHRNSGAEGDETAANPHIAAEKDSSGSFKTFFPVTLIDPAGQLWNMTYVTTSRYNLYSGRLVDGWEKFCCANRLRIGDEIEFAKVEANDHEGWRLRTGAIARVDVRKKLCRSQ